MSAPAKANTSQVDRIVLQFSTSASSPFFWTGWKNRWSYVIRCLCHSNFSHVDFVLENGNVLGASDQGPLSPCVHGSPLGVAIRPPDYQLFGIRRQLVLRTDKAALILDFAYSQLGKPFDNSALHNFLSPELPGTRDWRSPEKWFCSELALCAIEASGYFAPVLGKAQLPVPKNRVSPNDLLEILLLDSNWENRDTFWDRIPGLKLDPGEI
jgi:hypothetical protein